MNTFISEEAPKAVNLVKYAYAHTQDGGTKGSQEVVGCVQHRHRTGVMDNLGRVLHPAET